MLPGESGREERLGEHVQPELRQVREAEEPSGLALASDLSFQCTLLCLQGIATSEQKQHLQL